MLLALVIMCSCTTQPNIISGEKSIALSLIAQDLAMDLGWEPVQKIAILRNHELNVAVAPGSNMAWIDGETKRMAFAAYFDQREIYIPFSFYRNELKSRVRNDSTINPLRQQQTQWQPIFPEVVLNTTTANYKLAPVVCIVIDPGHGGRDPGAIGINKVYEKTLALSISKHVEQYLTRSGVKIIMTRNTDKYVDLDQRVKIANSTGADYFVSIHLNSATNNSATGFEIWIPRPQTGRRHKKSYTLAQSILKKLSTMPLRNRGIINDRRGLRVVRKTTMPMVLVECAFLSNKGECAWISKTPNQKLTAQNIAQGILQYLENVAHVSR